MTIPGVPLPPAIRSIPRRLRLILSRQLVLAIGVAIGPGVAIFFIVGQMSRSAHGRFGWEAAAVAGTGMATAVLAAFTVSLSGSTSELAAIEQARFAREDEAFVLGDTVHWVSDEMPVETSLVNVGRGPAQRLRWEAYWRSDTGEEASPPKGDPRRGSVGVLLPAERSEITFKGWSLGCFSHSLVSADGGSCAADTPTETA